jgi:excisionase family DNA binding protein
MARARNEVLEWVGVRAAAERCDLSERTIRQRISDGILPAYVPQGSRLLRIRVADIEQMMIGDGRIPAGHLGSRA